MSNPTAVVLPSVTFYCFSGRPNPQFNLSLSDWTELTVLINTLPPLGEEIAGRYSFEGGLGYTGFSAHFCVISSYPDVYCVSKKHEVVLSNAGGHVIYDDGEERVENWFKDKARENGIQCQ